MHKSLDGFEFRPDPSTDYGVSCPSASKKIDITTFSPLLLIRSFSNLQVMRTCIKVWMSLNLGQIPLLTMELAALEHLKNQRHHFFSVAIDPILFKLAGNEDMHNILDEFEFRPDVTTDYGVSCP